MRECGLAADDVVARISDRRLLTALLSAWGVPDESVGAAYAAIDKIDRDPQDVLVERLRKAGVSRSLSRFGFSPQPRSPISCRCVKSPTSLRRFAKDWIASSDTSRS